MIHSPASALALAAAAVAMLAGGASQAAPDAPADGAALHERHAALAPSLAQSPFGRPLVLASGPSSEKPSGDVYAVIDHGLEAVGTALGDPRNWCAMLLLQTNVKRCTPAGSGAGQRLKVAIARRHADAGDAAHEVEFRFEREARPGFVGVRLSADEGPMGTHGYRLRFEAVPIGSSTAFVHFAYAYETSLAARWAMSAYLSTAGRSKVGFTATGRDAQGQPLYVGGMQGVVERNTMRYFLAFESLLATLPVPPSSRAEQRLRHFHAALERYPVQLHELTLEDYLAMKRREPAAAAAGGPAS